MKSKSEIDVEKKVVIVRNTRVILDYDVAAIYQVETKRINEAVKNNLERFPEGYFIQLTRDELSSLRSKFSTLDKPTRGQHSKYMPKAFTEKGLYMLATILKSKKAVQATFEIIETFARIREMSTNLADVMVETDETKRQDLIKRSGEIMSEVLNENLLVSDTETTIEVNFAMLKIKHTVKRKKNG